MYRCCVAYLAIDDCRATAYSWVLSCCMREELRIIRTVVVVVVVVDVVDVVAIVIVRDNILRRQILL